MEAIQKKQDVMGIPGKILQPVSQQYTHKKEDEGTGITTWPLDDGREMGSGTGNF